MKEEPIRVQIRGSRKTFFPPLIHPPSDDSPPDKRLTLNWVYPFKALLSNIIILFIVFCNYYIIVKYIILFAHYFQK